MGVSATQRDSFTYDDLSRLKAADVHRNGGLHKFTYTYDAYGNLTARSMVVPTAYQGQSLNQYLTQTLQLDPSEASEYIQATVFSATVGTTGGAANNRLNTVTRAANTGLVPAPPPANMTYDLNGNLVGDGKFAYAYDALNRQVSVTEVSTSHLVAEYAYLSSGERIAALKYEGGEFADYTRYVRDGAAVVWEQSDARGYGKSYVYAGGRVAYTHEAWRICIVPLGMSASSLTLGTPTVTAPLGSATATAEFALPLLPAAAEAVEVRLVKGNSLVSSQRIERPVGGWCGQERVTFIGLPEGADYQAGLTVFAREGRAKRLPPNAYLVERMKLGLIRGKLAAWTAMKLKEEGGGVREEATTGFASLAPAGAEDYTATARKGSAVQQVAQGQNAEEVALPEGSTAVAVQGTAGSALTLASPSLGMSGGFGGGERRCTDYALRTYYGVDHLGTVRYTKSYDLDYNEVATSTHDYEPFGVEIPGGNTGCDNTHRFTGHERDAETGNDYMHFRYFSAGMGRFMKPDNMSDGAAANPQGWNLYTYVKGNPVNFNDPTGHQTPPPTTVPPSNQGQAVTDARAIGGPAAGRGAAAPGKNAAANGPIKRAIEKLAKVVDFVRRMIGPQLLLPIGGVTLSEKSSGEENAGKVLDTVDQAASLLSVADDLSSIVVTESGAEHVVERHTESGDKNSGKSQFSPDVDLGELLKAADQVPATEQPGGNYERVVDFGKPVGKDRARGNEPTSTFTVITDKDKQLRTMFPGIPNPRQD